MDSLEVEKKILNILLENEIVHFRFDPPYVFSSGLKSPVYIDNRILISYPKERAIVTAELVKLIKDKIGVGKVDFISSSLTWAAPFGTMVAEALNLPFVLIRERYRTFGKQNKIEGRLPRGKRTLLVEDTVSTGANVLDNAKAVREAGGKVEYCVAINDFNISIGNKALKANKIKLHTLAHCAPLVDMAAKSGMITNKQKDEVLEWFSDPVKWGKERGYYAVD